MEINYALIGKRIRETRKQRGLSAEELAEIADLSTVYISYIENAKRKPSLESLIKLATHLKLLLMNYSMGTCYTILRNIKLTLIY